MGTTPTLPCPSPYTIHQPSPSSPHSSSLTLLHNPSTHQQLCLRTLSFQSHSCYLSALSSLTPSLHKPFSHLSTLHSLTPSLHPSPCSPLYQLTLLFDHPFKTLHEELHERRTNNQPFKENEILSILYSCLMGVKEMNEEGECHGGIRGEQVYVDRGGVVRLIPPKLLGGMTNLELLQSNVYHHRGTTTALPLAPEEILAYRSSQVYNLNKADVFAIGMLGVQCVTMRPLGEFYLEGYEGVDERRVREVLDEMGGVGKYSRRLGRVMARLLEMHPEKRGEVDEVIRIMCEREGEEERERNVENREDMKNNFYRTMRVSKMVRSTPVLTATNPPNIKIVRQKQGEKENVGKEFPQPQRATVWVPKTLSKPELTCPPVLPSLSLSLNPLKQQSSNLPPPLTDSKPLQETLTPEAQQPLPPPVKTKIIRIIPTPQLPKPPRLPLVGSEDPFCLKGLEGIKEDLEKISITSRECLEFVKQKSFPIYPETIVTSPPLKSPQQQPETFTLNTSNNTIPQVTQPQSSSQLLQPSSLPFSPQPSTPLHYPDGSSYLGPTLCSLRHGHGTLHFPPPSPSFYTGSFHLNKFHGHGLLFYSPTHLAYEGSWKHDEFHGWGKIYNDKPNYGVKGGGGFEEEMDFGKLEDHWVYYEGEWREDVKHGKGRVGLTNGAVFEGEWKEDVVDGWGRVVGVKGETREGWWRGNKFVGDGKEGGRGKQKENI